MKTLYIILFILSSISSTKVLKFNKSLFKKHELTKNNESKLTTKQNYHEIKSFDHINNKSNALIGDNNNNDIIDESNEKSNKSDINLSGNLKNNSINQHILEVPYIRKNRNSENKNNSKSNKSLNNYIEKNYTPLTIQEGLEIYRKTINSYLS